MPSSCADSATRTTVVPTSSTSPSGVARCTPLRTTCHAKITDDLGLAPEEVRELQVTLRRVVDAMGRALGPVD